MAGDYRFIFLTNLSPAKVSGIITVCFVLHLNGCQKSSILVFGDSFTAVKRKNLASLPVSSVLEFVSLQKHRGLT